MPHGGLHWAKGGPIIRRRPGNLSPLKGLIFRRIAGPRPAAVATFFRRCAAHLDALSMLTHPTGRGRRAVSGANTSPIGRSKLINGAPGEGRSWDKSRNLK